MKIHCSFFPEKLIFFRDMMYLEQNEDDQTYHIDGIHRYIKRNWCQVHQSIVDERFEFFQMALSVFTKYQVKYFLSKIYFRTVYQEKVKRFYLNLLPFRQS